VTDPTAASASPRRLVVGWLAAAIVTAACLPFVLSPDFLNRAPVADRGFFMACGRLITRGAVMYRDIFDNKPPFIHMLSAFGWWLSPTPQSVYRVERVAVLLLCAALFAMLRFGLRFRLVPSLIGLAGALITLRNPEIFQGGHLTEEYGILFEAAGVTCLGLALERARAGTRAAALAFAAGLCGALMLLCRQSFLVSLTVIWLALHAPLFRRPAVLARLVGWELAGFLLPLLVWLAYVSSHDALRAFLELGWETMAFATRNDKGPLPGRLMTALEWMLRKLVQSRHDVAIAMASVAALAITVAEVRAWQRRPVIAVSPLLLPLWFAAELVAASAPGEHYGHYYMPFVPLWACTFALVADIMLPRELRFAPASAVRVVVTAVLLIAAVNPLDARYRADQRKYWYLWAPQARLPASLVQQLEDGATRFGWRTYVPLDTMATQILLDMPLEPATRFLVQYRYQFDGPTSPRGAELLAALARADVVAEDTNRLPLDDALEHEIRTVLRASFTPLLTWTAMQFYVRRQ
jgi:hypothetical protein